MTTSVAVFPPGFRVTDANDNPVSGATIEFYASGTTTPKTVYSDAELLTAIGTSVTTDAGGYPTSGGNKTLVYVDTSYKIVIKDALGATVATHDNIPGPSSGSSSSSSTAATTFGMNVGDVKMSLAATPDAGFIRLGETAQTLAKATYPDLNAWVAAQGYPWGSATTTFNIPPAAGYFLRFAASSSSIDTAGARAPGSTQGDQFAAHTHTNTATASTSISHNANANNPQNIIAGSGVTVTGYVQTAGASISATTTVTMANASAGTGTETRAKNVAMHADMLAVPALVSAALVGAGALAYKFNSTTSPGSVTSGTLAFNNGTLGSATALYIHETDNNGDNLAAVLQQFTSRSILLMTKVGAPTNWIAATLSSAATDAGSYDSYTLSAVSSAGTISNGDLLNVTPLLAGPAGPTGSGSGDLLASLNLSDVASPKTGFDNISVKGADVASASTIDLDAATGNLIDVTGTTTITAITLAAGRERMVRFTGALTLTHGSSLVLPNNGANITTAAGDYALFRGYAAGVVRCAFYQKANGQALASSGGGGGGGDIGFQLQNVGLSASVAANALTVTLTDKSGSNPSGSTVIPFRHATLTNGTRVDRTLTGTYSVTVPASQALGTANATASRLWVLAIDNAGTVELAVINCLLGGATPTGVYPLDEALLLSTTAIASAPSAGVPYSTTARSSVPFRIIGFVEFSGGQATAGTWATSPSKVHNFGPGNKKPGDIVQIVTGLSTTTTTTSSATFASSSLTAAITPTNTANPVLWGWTAVAYNNAGAGDGLGTMYRGSTALQQVEVYSSAASIGFGGMSGIDYPQSTSSQTYALKTKAVAGSFSLPYCGSGNAATMKLEEIMG